MLPFAACIPIEDDRARMSTNESDLVGGDRLAPALPTSSSGRPTYCRFGGDLAFARECAPGRVGMSHARSWAVVKLQQRSFPAGWGVLASPQELRPLLLGQYSSRNLARAFLPHRRLGDDHQPTPVGLFTGDGAFIELGGPMVP